MRIAFVDFLPWDYQIESAYQIALGGSVSALCYLAEALAKQGHQIFLLNNTSEAGMSRGVNCLPLKNVRSDLLQSLDAAIVLNYAGQGVEIKPLLGENSSLVLWTGHADDQAAMQRLQTLPERDIYDGIAFVSDWQRDRFKQHFGINLDRTAVLRNAIAPTFLRAFPKNTPILAQKPKPPVLAYTSTPFRGLDILLEVFPQIRKAVPGTRLKVFSSMKVYLVSEAEDESEYGLLYRQCRETEGVEYIGSIPQPDLARELRSITALAYPNTFPETSCIAVMEAMASGCWIVTSDLGALPETTAGFARLIPIGDNPEAYKDRFVEETVQVLRKCTATDITDAETHLREQVVYVNTLYSWSVRACEWVQWLNFLSAKTAVADSQLLEPYGASIFEKQQQAYHCLVQGDYDGAGLLYEQAVEASPAVTSCYWYLGLTLLLHGEEVQAVSTWMLAMVDGSDEQVNLWMAELAQVLRTEAERREAIQDYPAALLIQQQIRQISLDSP